MFVNRKVYNSLSLLEKYELILKLTQENKFNVILYYVPVDIKIYEPASSDYLERIIYLHYAGVLGTAGQCKVSGILLEKYINILLNEEIVNVQQFAHVGFNVCDLLERFGDRTRALEITEFILEIIKDNPKARDHFGPMFYHIKLRSNAFFGNYDEAEVNKLIEEFKGTHNSVHIEYFECLKTYYQIEFSIYNFDNLVSEINEKIQTRKNVYESYYRYYLASLYHENGYLKKAHDLLLECSKDLDLSDCGSLIEALYRLEDICYDSLTFEQKVLIRCYPNLEYIVRSLDSFANKKYKKLTELKENQVWYIVNKMVLGLDYHQVKSLNMLDLKVGVLIKNGSVEMILSRMRAKALMYIIGGSFLGITTLELARQLFFEENVTLDTMHLRVQDIITQLKKSGFPISRKDGRLYFIFDDFNYDVIIPKDFEVKEVVYYLAKETIFIDSKNTCKSLNIARSQYWNLIKKWKELKLVQKDSSGDRYQIALK